MDIHCPKCGARTSFRNNPHRPFCSERCKLIDLGQWMAGSYILSPQSKDEEENSLPDRDEEKAGK